MIPLRPAREDRAARQRVQTTVLHALPGDGLVQVAPVIAALERRRCFRQVVVHADGEAQHGAEPCRADAVEHHHLGVAGGTPGERTAALLVGFEAALRAARPDVVLVFGDDDVALAAALAAARLQLAVAHLGAGVRSWDWTLPEEVNRSVVDRLSDTLFATDADGAANLRREGVPAGRIHAVGNPRIDTLRRSEASARRRAAWTDHGASERGYVLVALQRLASLQGGDRLERFAGALAELGSATSVLLLVHPHTRPVLEQDAATALLAAAGVRCVGPAGYLEALSLAAGARAVITDAAAVQEDTSALGVPCYTALATTASTVTLTHGTNVLLGDDPCALASIRLATWAPIPPSIPLWDGRTSERVADVLVANYALTAAQAEDR